mmetsp:Transcript_50623/g.151355  ORF Transcript_50623/g.151355 Transcript_50623/m.151355 type:complete len:226 (+) Transcript_50623:192-869(+)
MSASWQGGASWLEVCDQPRAAARCLVQRPLAPDGCAEERRHGANGRGFACHGRHGGGARCHEFPGHGHRYPVYAGSTALPRQRWHCHALSDRGHGPCPRHGDRRWRRAHAQAADRATGCGTAAPRHRGRGAHRLPPRDRQGHWQLRRRNRQHRRRAVEPVRVRPADAGAARYRADGGGAGGERGGGDWRPWLHRPHARLHETLRRGGRADVPRALAGQAQRVHCI